VRPRAGATWLACAAAVLPMVALAAPRDAPVPAGSFAVPDRPMVLTRTLRRPLPDGKEIITLRSYLLHFTPIDDGVRIDGELLAVTVDAPPVLQAMAELERARPDPGMFPMWLDRDGMLRAGNPAPTGPARNAAVDQVVSRIGALPLPAPDAAQAQAFARQFRGGGGGTPWPRDLFRPVPGERLEDRTVPLPDGQNGSVSVATQTAVTAKGLLASYTRRITTDMAGDRRISIEEWALIGAQSGKGIILPSR
jgi:hypothetical protein